MECCRVSVSQKKIHDRLVESGCVLSVSVCVFFCLFFCQAHHCGAFIQKHSSIVTVFLSLMHSHVFV